LGDVMVLSVQQIVQTIKAASWQTF